MGRPLSSAPSAATLRKRRQVARQRAEGRGLLLLSPAPETMHALAKLTKVTGRGAKGEAEAILRRAVGSALAELRQLAATLGPVYREAKIYEPYAEFLRTADAKLRIGDRELCGADWLPLAQKLGAFGDWCRRMRWPADRAKAFLEAAAAGTLEL